MNITESEIREFLEKYEAATNTHHFSNVTGFIHSDAIFRFTDGDFIGIEAIQKAFELTWESIKDEVYAFSNLKIVTTDVKTASISYDFEWSGIVDWEEKSGSGRGTNILIRNGNSLQLIYEHLSK